MPFITNYNCSRLQNSLFYSEEYTESGILYKKPIYFFSQVEKRRLLMYQLLLKNKEAFNEQVNQHKIKFQNKLPNKAAYHFYKDCTLLNSPYTQVVQERDHEGNLFSTTEERRNSGVHEISFRKTLEQVEIEIEEYIEKLDKLLVDEPVIKSFITKTYILQNSFDKVNTSYGIDQESYEKLKDVNEKLKFPLYRTLFDYYGIKYNPELDFDEIMLQRLNFKPCHECLKRKLLEGTIS